MAENRLRDKLAVAKVRRLRRAADTVALASPRLHGLRHHLPRARRQAGRPRRQARRQAHRRAQGCERHRQGPDLQGYAPAVFRTRRFDAAKTSISILPALPACSSFRPSRTRDDADPDPHPSRVAVDKAAAVAAASTLAVTPAARASELGEVRSFFHHGNRQPLGGGTRSRSAETDPPRSRGAGFTKRRRRRFFSHPGRRFAIATAVDPNLRAC